MKALVLDDKINMDSEKGAEQKGELSDQISQLQNLVEQMKEGFVHAMEELSNIQDGDRLLQRTVAGNKAETDKMIEELTCSVQQIRTDVSSVLEEVQKSNKKTEELAEQFESLKKEQGRIRKKLKQNEQNLEKQRQEHRKQSIPQSSRSDSNNNNNSNNSKAATTADKIRRRKSMPGGYLSPTDDQEDKGTTKESRVPLAPMIQPFMDSLPDPNDLNNNVGRGALFNSPEGTESRLFEFSVKCNSGSTVSSELHEEEREHTVKAFNTGRRVSFGNLDRTQDSNTNISNEGQRLQLAEAFLLSERKYVGQLNALRENIMLPLVTESLIHPSDINIIFPPCLAKMFDRHCCLLCALETRLSDAQWKGMHGDIFAQFTGVRNANFLSLYGSYISTFPESLSLLSRHTWKSTKLTKFLKKQLSDIEEQADLLGYLLAPIQRIPAYVLHLKTVLEYTESDHPDYFHVESCLTHLGNFLATMNPAIEQAVQAARTHKLFLSERRGSRASSYSPQLLSSQSSSLTKDSGVQSMEDMPAYDGYAHHQNNQEDVSGMTGMMGDMNGVWNSSPARQRKSPSNCQTLPNGYRRGRRASLPGFSLVDSQRRLNQEAMVHSSPRLSKSKGRLERRGSYDQRMLSAVYQGMPNSAPMSGVIPGMMYLPEQINDNADDMQRQHSMERHRIKGSRSHTNLPDLPKYGIYGEDDTDIEVGYEPSSLSNASPRARQSNSNHQQLNPRHTRRFSTPVSSAASSRTSTPRDDHYYVENGRAKVIFEESDIHPQQRYHQRSSPSSSQHLRHKDLSYDERVSSSWQLQQMPKLENRRRAHSISHLNRVGTPESTKPGILKDVWNEGEQVNGSTERISTPRTKQKSSLNKTPRGNPTPATKSAKKSNSLAGSLRNIFFGKSTIYRYSRKRGNHVVELEEETMVNGSTAGERNASTPSSMKSDTYRDEDGQPCSDV